VLPFLLHFPTYWEDSCEPNAVYDEAIAISLIESNRTKELVSSKYFLATQTKKAGKETDDED
jgi:hypothetical protein